MFGVGGCLSRYLDAPYVLTTGLGAATGIQWGPEPATFRVTTATGTWLVHQDGSHELMAGVAGAPTMASLSIETSRGVLTVDGDGVLRRDGVELSRGLEQARGLTCDRAERVYVVSGSEEPALYRVDGVALTLVAEWVGPVEGVAWGSGGWLREDTLYLVRSDGVLEYLQPPP